MIPAWLQRTRAGEAFRAVALRTCHRCRSPILVGLDADMCAITVRADPTPLTQLGEAIAVLQGRTTYDLVSYDGRKELNPRNAHHIKSERRYTILADHHCGQSLTAHAESSSTDRKRLPEEPPF